MFVKQENEVEKVQRRNRKTSLSFCFATRVSENNPISAERQVRERHDPCVLDGI